MYSEFILFYIHAENHRKVTLMLKCLATHEAVLLSAGELNENFYSTKKGSHLFRKIGSFTLLCNFF